VHANAPLTPEGRLRMCRRIEAGHDITQVARFMGISRPTASKWWNRYLEEGEAGLVDRRSVPHTCPTRLSVRQERRIIGLRINRRWGPERIAGHLGLHSSTVWRVLKRYGISKLRHLDPGLAEPVVRYEATTPGELAHIDVKRFTRIPDGGGWKAHGKGNVAGVKGVGKTYLHSMVDDHTRLAYSEFCDNETALTCLEYTRRAVQWFADRGVSIRKIMTDNAPGYRSDVYCDTIESVGIGHVFTRSYRPQTNGKVERFQQTLDREWAAARLWTSNEQRQQDLPRWLHQYNHHRYHSAVGGAPITRVNNLRQHYS
jgi:transposase InsO family protein